MRVSAYKSREDYFRSIGMKPPTEAEVRAAWASFTRTMSLPWASSTNSKNQ